MGERTAASGIKIEDLEGQIPGVDFLELIGEGGMGQVFRARQKSLDREVAIKILRPSESFGDPAFSSERFKQEAKTMARLQHPNIVTVFDFGVTKSGHFYLVMELVGGGDLADQMAKRKIPVNEALVLAQEIASALEYAHDQGIIHRDVKPGNVLLSGEGRAKVSDFGLSKILEQASGGNELTATGVAAGTPEYMAPEQKAGDVAADHRADIFSLGVLIYEMLTGIRPAGRWKSPSQSGVKVSNTIDRIVEKSVEFDPGERFQAVTEIRKKLEKETGPKTKVFWRYFSVVALISFLIVFCVVFLQSTYRKKGLEKFLISEGKSENMKDFRTALEKDLGWLGDDFGFAFRTPLEKFPNLLPAKEFEFRPGLMRVIPSTMNLESTPVVISTWHRGAEEWKVAYRSPEPVSKNLHPYLKEHGWTLSDHSPPFAGEHFGIWTKNHPEYEISEPHTRRATFRWAADDRDDWVYARGCYALGTTSVYELFTKRRNSYGFGVVHFSRRSLQGIKTTASGINRPEGMRLMHVNWTGREPGLFVVMAKKFAESPAFERKLIYADLAKLEDLHTQSVELAEAGWTIQNISIGLPDDSPMIFLMWERW